MFKDDLASIFAEDGPFAQGAPGYRLRPAQLEMAQAIAEAIRTRGTLVAEAGTGTGKTWAYLVPAILSGGKTIISTGTRTLQDQLFKRDLPKVRKALSVPVAVALLKGRSNYVCHYHLERLEEDDRGFRSRTEAAQLRKIQVFAKQSQTGDKVELSSVPENADIWNRVSSTRENCLGQDCPHVRECFVMKARKQAQEAEVLVVNHALFMADLALREEGIVDLLPQADTVVFDEAHQLPDTATRFLGESVSTHQLLDLARDMAVVGLAQAREALNWSEAGRQLEHAVREWRLSAAAIEQMPGRKATAEALPDADGFHAALDVLIERVGEAADRLKKIEEKHPDLAAQAKVAQTLLGKLGQWLKPEDPQGCVRWVEMTHQGMRLHSAPLSVAEAFSRCRRKEQAWVMVSATLSVQGNFTHFTRQLGLWEPQVAKWESPFDYASQGLLFVPSHMPLPNSPAFNERFIDTLMPLLDACQGGALVLCTTLRAVDIFADSLARHFEARGWDWPLLRQGQTSRHLLLERFRTEAHAVLVGSASFWEGVDVPGDALRLLAIDKLPFAPPDDPVIEARLRSCRERGGNPFAEFQLPEAAIALKQGAGRLIRTERDWGVLMVGDVRLVDKPYGRRLWRGLPPFARTRDLQVALDFYTGRMADMDATGAS